MEKLEFIRVGLRKRGVSTRLRLRWDRSPMTCAAVAPILPVEGQVFHAKYANNEIYCLVPMVEKIPPSEWRCLYPGPGDLLFSPIDSGHSANLVNNALAGYLPPMDPDKGILDFAFFYERGNCLIGPAGPSRGSLFATGTSFDELEIVAAAARDVWFNGAAGEKMYIERA